MNHTFIKLTMLFRKLPGIVDERPMFVNYQDIQIIEEQEMYVCDGEYIPVTCLVFSTGSIWDTVDVKETPGEIFEKIAMNQSQRTRL